MIIREKLFTEENVKQKDEKLFELLVPLKFTSPSTVAGFVIGYNVNGWDKLKNKAGKNIK